MSTSMQADTPRLWTREGFREDPWQRATEEQSLEPDTPTILSMQAFEALDPARREEALSRIGVEVLAGEKLDPLLPFLDKLPLIALAFPAFNDGRSYSKAALLRSRLDFKGELRATGDVLIDQIAHMLRCGFTTFEVSNPTTLARLEAGHPGGIPLYYQPAASEAHPAAATETPRAQYSWRRLPA